MRNCNVIGHENEIKDIQLIMSSCVCPNFGVVESMILAIILYRGPGMVPCSFYCKMLCKGAVGLPLTRCSLVSNSGSSSLCQVKTHPGRN